MKKETLRSRAEELIKQKGYDLPMSTDACEELVHELAVHQIEIEMQNCELRTAQDELLSSEAKLIQLFDSAPCGYVTLDRNGIVQEANIAIANMLSVPRNRLVGRPIMAYIAPQDHTTFFDSLEYSFVNGTALPFDLQLRCRCESSCVVRANCKAIKTGNDAGKCLCTLEDITSLREKELELQRRQEAEKQILQLESDNEWLKKIDQLKSMFLTSVSHELRTPLTSIMGFSRLVLRDFNRHFSDQSPAQSDRLPKADRIQDNLEIISRESERLGNLINNMLDLSQIESGHPDWNDQEIDPKGVICGATEALGGLFLSNNALEVHLKVAQDLPLITIDPERLNQVLINILSNAFKFTQNGHILVSACATVHDTLVIQVEDTGAGVKRDELLNIFDKFYQAYTGDTLEKNPGIGLGLPLSRQIIQHYGGEIWAESSLGQGTLITIELPTSENTTDH